MSAVPLSQLMNGRVWRSGFAQVVLPHVETHARIQLRHLKPEAREEAVANAVAHAFVAVGQLAQRQQLARAFVSTVAQFAVCATRNGRKVGTRQAAKDVMSPIAQRRHGFRVKRLSEPRALAEWRQATLDNRHVTPSDAAAFAIDFREWLGRFDRRKRRIINRLATGESSSDVARRVGVSPGRIAQLRREFEDSWRRFQGEELPVKADRLGRHSPSTPAVSAA